MKATVLADNIASGTLDGEWGLSIYIEYGETNILLDTGASDLFLRNAEKLGKSIPAVDYAVLSHAHYDHADGMQTFFANNEKASFYLRSGSGETCYDKRWIFRNYIGLPKGILNDYKTRIVFAQGDTALCPGVWLIPHKTAGLAQIGRKNHMYVRTAQGWKADDFSHEQSLVFETAQGLVIFNSCSHGGAATIVQEIRNTWPNQEILALVGGFHLFTQRDEEIRQLAAKLRDTGVREIYTGHCTGKRACRILQEELGGLVHPFHTGLVMEWPTEDRRQ